MEPMWDDFHDRHGYQLSCWWHRRTNATHLRLTKKGRIDPLCDECWESQEAFSAKAQIEANERAVERLVREGQQVGRMKFHQHFNSRRK